MTRINESLLAAVTVVLFGSILSGCYAYQDRVIASNEASAIFALRLIHDQETIRRNETKKYVSLEQLFSQADGISSPSQSNPGYRFEMRVKEGGKSFEAFATPAQYGKTGRRSFYMNEDGVIHGRDKGGGEGAETDSEVK